MLLLLSKVVARDNDGIQSCGHFIEENQSIVQVNSVNIVKKAYFHHCDLHKTKINPLQP